MFVAQSQLLAGERMEGKSGQKDRQKNRQQNGQTLSGTYRWMLYLKHVQISMCMKNKSDIAWINILTKISNDLARSEMSYIEQEITCHELQQARNNLKRHTEF